MGSESNNEAHAVQSVSLQHQARHKTSLQVSVPIIARLVIAPSFTMTKLSTNSGAGTNQSRDNDEISCVPRPLLGC